MLEEVQFKDKTHPQFYSWGQMLSDVRSWFRGLFRDKYPVFTVLNTKGRSVQVRDSMGRRIPYVAWYDPNRREAGVYLPIKSDGPGKVMVVANGRAAIARVRLPGSTIEVDGVKY